MVINAQAVILIATDASKQLISVHLAKAIRSLQLPNLVSRVISVSIQRIPRPASVPTVSIWIRTFPAMFVMTQTALSVMVMEKSVKSATLTSSLELRRSVSVLDLDITKETLNAACAWMTATNALMPQAVASAH